LAEALFLLGWVLQDQGSYAEAETTLLRALKLYQSQEPQNELKVAQVQFNLAWLLADVQRRAEAESLFRQVLETRRKRLSPRDLELAAAQIGLVAVLLADNRERDALMLSLADTPPEHSAKLIGCLVDYQRIATHRQKGEWADAERACRGMLSVVNDVFVEHHPVRVLVLGELAGIQQAGGDMVAAEATIREAIRIGRRCLGEHPKMWEPLSRFAEELHARGDWREAQEWADSAWRIVSQRLPEQELRTFDIRSDVAWLRGKLAWDAGQSEAALSFFRESIAWRRRTTPDDAPHAHAITFAERLAELSRFLAEAGQFDEAERTLREARDLAQRRHSAHQAICWTLQLAPILIARGDSESARRMRDDAETLLRSSSPVAENCSRDECRDWLRCWAAAKQPQEAVKFARHSLLCERSLPTRDRPDVATHALTLANLEVECGNWEAADMLLAESLTLMVKKYGEFQTQAERVRLTQARTWAHQDRLADAERLAIEVAQRLDRKFAFDDNHLDRAMAWLTVGQIQRRAGSSAARESLERSLRMHQAKLPARHPAVLEAANVLDQFPSQRPLQSKE
jgi:tetratricopeptide (TPR) repeat protein